MKFLRHLALLAACIGLAAGLQAQTKAVTKGVSDNALTENLTVPSGKTLTLAGNTTISGNLTANGATLTPTELGRIDGISAYGQSLISGADASAVRSTLSAAAAVLVAM